MRNLFRRLWNEDDGSIVVGDWVFVATILVLGAITGTVMFRQNAASDAEDLHPLPEARSPVTAPNQ
jgi:hypothetical protein